MQDALHSGPRHTEKHFVQVFSTYQTFLNTDNQLSLFLNVFQLFDTFSCTQAYSFVCTSCLESSNLFSNSDKAHEMLFQFFIFKSNPNIEADAVWYATQFLYSVCVQLNSFCENIRIICTISQSHRVVLTCYIACYKPRKAPSLQCTSCILHLPSLSLCCFVIT